MADQTLSIEEIAKLREELSKGLAELDKMLETATANQSEAAVDDFKYSQEELEKASGDWKEELKDGFDQTPIEEVERAELTREKMLQEKQKELRQKQKELRKIKFSIFVKEQREKIADRCERLKQGMKNTAKIYGDKAQKCAEDYILARDGKKSIIEEYKRQVEEIDLAYQEDLEASQEELNGLQKAEQCQIAKISEYMYKKRIANHNKESKKIFLAEEIKKAIERDDFDKIIEKTEQLRKLKQNASKYDEKIAEENQKLKEIQAEIEACKRGMDERDEFTNQQFDSIVTDRDEKIAGLTKQNFIQKAIGFVVNKFNGVKKFTKNVIAKIQDKINRMATEDLPIVQEEMAQRSEEREQRENEYDEKYWSEQVTEIFEQEAEATHVEPHKSKEEIKAEKKAEKLRAKAEKRRLREEKRDAKYQAAMEAMEKRIAALDEKVGNAQARYTGQLNMGR